MGPVMKVRVTMDPGPVILGPEISLEICQVTDQVMMGQAMMKNVSQTQVLLLFNRFYSPLL